MSDHHRSYDPDSPDVPSTTSITRRHLLTGSAAMVTAPALARSVGAHEASPPDDEVGLEDFRALCRSLVGVDDLPDESLEELLGLMNGDPWSAEGMRELIDHAAGESDTAPISLESSAAAANILQYWYVGEFNGEPIENRAERFSGLIAHQVLPYVTIQAVCKEYGYWAEELDLPDRNG